MYVMLLSDHQGQIHGNKQATCFSPLVVALLLFFLSSSTPLLATHTAYRVVVTVRSYQLFFVF